MNRCWRLLAVLAFASIAARCLSTKQHATTHHLDEASELALGEACVRRDGATHPNDAAHLAEHVSLGSILYPGGLSLSSTSFGQVLDRHNAFLPQMTLWRQLLADHDTALVRLV